MSKRLGVALALIALFAAACGSSAKTTSAPTTAATTGASITVNIDGKPAQFVGSLNKFFPSQVTVTQGETIVFKENWTGSPHTVTMGSLVDAGLAAAQAAGPNSHAPVPAYDSLPTLISQQPPVDFHQNAAQPCYLDTGSPPTDRQNTPCPTATQPAFSGHQTYYNSGFLSEGSSFTVKLTDDLAPGTYRYYCNLHGPGMSGTIVVKAKGTTVPSAADVAAAAKTEQDALEAKVVPAVQAASSGHALLPGNLAGYGDPNVSGADANQFFPAVINAKVGQKVSWTMIGVHTITFGASADLKNFAVKGADGSWHLKPASFAPAGGPGAPPPANAPPAGPPVPRLFDGGAYDGTGEHSSGFVASFPGSPTFYAYSLTFTKPGSYPYTCVIHPGMDGVVNVT